MKNKYHIQIQHPQKHEDRPFLVTSTNLVTSRYAFLRVLVARLEVLQIVLVRTDIIQFQVTSGGERE